MPKRRRLDDPIANYIEWTRHRYDPGHYLGGNLPPHLRSSALGPRGRRFAGLLLGVITAMSVVNMLGMLAFGGITALELVAWTAAVMLVGAAAMKMFRSGRAGRGQARK